MAGERRIEEVLSEIGKSIPAEAWLPTPPPWMQVSRTHETFGDGSGSHTAFRGAIKRGHPFHHAQQPATIDVLTADDGRTQVAVSAGYMDLDAIPWLVGVLQKVAGDARGK